MNRPFSETRRLVTAGFLTVLVAFTGGAPAESDAAAAFADTIAAMERRVGGAIGVHALDTDTGRELAHRADERFAMASTFKPLLVAAVLAEVDAGRLELGDTFGIGAVEIQPYSPVIGELDGGDTITLSALCDAAVALGDNTASNMLLDLVGGPEGLTAFLRRNGDDTTRLDRYEIELNENAEGDVRDTTTPRAMTASMRRVLFSGILGDDSAKRLEDRLVASTTGRKRLRAGLPETWRVGDKTGTGMNGAVNDVAVAWPPDRGPVLIAVYLSRSEADVATLAALHPGIAELVVAHLAP